MVRAGLIGLSSSGKTTLFQLLTQVVDNPGSRQGRQDAAIAVARVPDPRLDRLTELFAPRKHTPATVNFVDMPTRRGTGAGGLVDVAPYREADALLHVARAFRDEAVPHPAESVDPGRDVRTMEDELILADLVVAERRIERLARDRKRGPSKTLDAEHDVLGICRQTLEGGTALRTLELDAEAARLLRGFQFLSAKPMLLVLNVDEAEVGVTPAEAVRAAGLEGLVTGATVRAVTACAKIELEIAALDADDAAAFLADLGLEDRGLDRIVRATYELLGYVSFFTTGEDECRAWSIPAGTVAPVAAGEIHTDIARGFIRAEVVAYDALVGRGSLAECRKHAEVRLEGRDYVVQDGDVINFRFAT